jgi:beta-N-acetylhexosaminidase
VSDDLEMGAVTETCSIGEAAVRAAAAGHDLLLVCHTAANQRAAAAALVDAYTTGTLPKIELERAVARVRTLAARRTARAEGGAPHAERDAATIASAAATRAVTELRPGAPGFAKTLNGRVAAIFPRFSALAPRITIEPAIADERGYLRGTFGRAGVNVEPTVVGIEPTPEEIGAAADAAGASDATVLFLFDAHLYASNRALLTAVEARAKSLAVVLMRDPYDAVLLGPHTLGITAYGFRKCQLDAVIARLCYPRE